LEKNLDMNKNYLFSKVMPSIYQYSYVYELEYSPSDIILIYELEYSFYVMIMSNKTLSLIVHTMFMSRIRIKLRWWFIMSSGMPKSLTCRSVGSGTRGGLGSFSVCGRDARIQRNG
jgi:hypothetical protein